ncbi:unnamed protein product [Zymoseptoria tritici ST99CH_3D7]|uniref:Poly(A) RNA polymerase mitochondrial-like central palm domain-containing protein n=1 Tax=Zymoseptoria tritici (strain ST99CH_3D7) TaxID=1276538 RepID=A0A1X7RW71_ZYMT9|nr:unnamed protein product [Zymoseptoria tritici ST99CH_3D7]
MQCPRLVSRAACRAQNAYNPTLALRSAFSTSLRQRQSEVDDALSSAVNEALGVISPPRIVRIPLGGRPSANKWKAKRKSDKTARREEEEKKKKNSANVVHEATQQDEQVPFVEKVVDQSEDQFGYSSLRWRKTIIAIRDKLKAPGPRTEEWQAELKHMCDYKPSTIQPMSPAGLNPAYPWVAKLYKSTESMTGTEYLSEEIRLFAEWIQSTPAELAAREAATSEVIDTIKQHLEMYSKPNDLSLELFGSSASGLALPTSDIDLRIHNPTTPNMAPRFLASTLRRLKRHLLEDHRYDDIQSHGEAYPMLEFRHIATGIHIQLVAGNDAQPQVNVVQRLTEETPNLKPLFHLLRVTLDMRGLVEVFYGGIGSYGLLVALAAALHRHPTIRHASLGEQFLYLLQFYGVDLDTSRTALTLSSTTFPSGRSKFFLKHDNEPAELRFFSRLAHSRNDLLRAGQWKMCHRSPAMPWLLCLQDPADPSNDLGRKSFAIKHVKHTLYTLKLHVRYLVRVRDEGGNVGGGRKLVMLRKVVGNCEGVYRWKRERLEGVGREVLAGKKMGEVVEGMRGRGVLGLGMRRKVVVGEGEGVAVKVAVKLEEAEGEERREGQREPADRVRVKRRRKAGPMIRMVRSGNGRLSVDRRAGLLEGDGRGEVLEDFERRMLEARDEEVVSVKTTEVEGEEEEQVLEEQWTEVMGR